MKRSSLVKILFFSLALLANARYAFFLFNPSHIDNLPFYLFTALADGIVITHLTFLWLSCLHFEVMKDRYYQEIDNLKHKGAELVSKKTAVFVPVVNEALALVEKTLKAVINIEGNKIIYLLDDGRREELRKLAKDLKIEYITREDRDYFKAGNLNNALKQINTEFVLVFDADFIPHKSFLKETLPFFIDEEVGAVQTPQVYYNSENLFAKGMANFQTVFYDYIMPSKHLLNSAFCVGTNVVYRKSALEKIGGIAKVYHSEDVFTALKLAENGYHIFYLNKSLAFGLAPNNIISFFNQQYRWAKGGLTMLFKHTTLFNKKLSFDQKIEFFFSNIYYLTGVSLVVYLISPFITILFNIRPINEAYFHEWLSAYGMFFLFNFVFYVLMIRKNKLQSMALGIFCFIPHLAALQAIILNKKFVWNPTNFLSGDVVTKLISPLITYIFATASILCLFLTKFLSFKINYFWYMFWIFNNFVLILYFVASSYKSVFFTKKS